MGIRVASSAGVAAVVVCALSAGCSGEIGGPGPASGGGLSTAGGSGAPVAGATTAGAATGGALSGGASAGGNSSVPSSGGSATGGATPGGAGGTSSGTAGTGGRSGSTGGSSSTGGSTNVAGAAPIQSAGPCNLESPAFCEDFEGPDQPGGRGGPVDETKWSISRFGIASTISIFSRLAATSLQSGAENTPTFCGQPFKDLLPPNDIKICPDSNGSRRLEEVLNDAGGFGFTSMMVRQPLDFTGRTGTIAFEVDAKRNAGYDGHGWWTEIWISKDPVPMPYHGAPTVASYVTDAVGFQIAPSGGSCFGDGGCNQVGRVAIAKDFKLTRDTGLSETQGFKVADGKVNRFKVLISQDQVEFWVADYDDPNNLRRVTVIKELGLRFSVGYLHLQHAQYNAGKANASPSQTFRWDNIGFDGPVLPRPRAYEIEDDGYSRNPGEFQMAYSLTSSKPVSVSFKDVDINGAKRATFGFNVHGAGNKELRYRFNGKEWHTFTTPQALDSDLLLRAFTVEVPISELVAGVNTVEMTQPEQEKPLEYVGNMDLTIDVQ